MLEETAIRMMTFKNDIFVSGLYRYKRERFARSSEEVRRTLGELKPKDEFHILLHSHYDPAWFARRDVTRKMLGPFYKKVINLLENNEEYKFTADSQTQVIEDILSNFKGKKRIKFEKKIFKAISSGKLVVGPYYAGIDLNLSSSAVLRRNIEYGLSDSRELGWQGIQTGWMIDQFGFPAQMWQLHKKFGIDSIILWRGVGLRPDEARSEIILESPDGSRMLGKWLFVQGYRFGLYVGKYSDIGVPRLIQESNKINRYTTSKQMLIMDGYEGEDTPDDPEKVVKMMRALGGRVKISTPGAFMSEMADDVKGKDLPVVRGYQNYGYYSPVLKGVISARQYVKQAHHLCDSVLTKFVDPFSVFSRFLGLEPGKERTEKMWRSLIRMASHDELGGCGIDDVHRDSMDVYREIYAESISYTDNLLEGISACIDTDTGKEDLPVVLFNTLPFKRSENIRIKVGLPRDWDAFSLYDKDGFEYESQIIGRDGNEWDLAVKFNPDNPLPAFGYRTLFFDKSVKEKPEDKNFISFGSTWMENRDVRIEIGENGTFSLTNKDTGRVFNELGYIRVEPDAGDTYDFSHIKNHEVITSLAGKASIEFEYSGNLEIKCKISYLMLVPSSLTEDRCSWTGDTEELKVSLYLILSRDSSRLDMKVHVDNKLRNARIRLCFPVETETEDMFVNRQFEVHRMPVADTGLSADEKRDIFSHMSGMISSGMDVVDVKTNINFKWVDLPVVKSGDSSIQESLGIINRDNFEFEIRDRDCRSKIVEFTLLRSVGWNARADLLTRNINAGWEIYTPDAFCYGEYQFSFSLLPHTGDWESGNLNQESDIRDTPVRSAILKKQKGDLPSEYSLFNIETRTIVISEITGTVSDRIVFILYNPGDNTGSIVFSFNTKVLSAHITDLDGNIMGEVVDGGRDEFSLSLRKKEIMQLTVKLEKNPVLNDHVNICTENKNIDAENRKFLLDEHLGLKMKPSVGLVEVLAEKNRWKECRKKYIESLSLCRMGIRLSDLDDFIKRYSEEEALINLENRVKEARYSYLLTLKRYHETNNRQKAADRVEKSVARMGRQLIDLRVKKREAEIYRIFFENLKKEI